MRAIGGVLWLAVLLSWSTWAYAQNDASQRSAAPVKEGVCETTPGSGQANMSNEACAYIASQIPVLRSNTPADLNSSAIVPSAHFRPGMDIPPDVTELKPLPQSVTSRFPSLKGDQYFLAGQNIVVVGPGAKVAFVIDVRVRPHTQ